MHTSLTDTDIAAGISPSMLDGYLAASASGPNFGMPDQVLRWVWEAGLVNDQTINNLIIQHYQAVSDALNDQVYVPLLTDPQAWCRGYLAGFATDMTAWAPLTATRPELLKVIMSGADQADLDDAARRIHAFWVGRRRTDADGGAVQRLLTALTPGHAVQSNQRLH